MTYTTLLNKTSGIPGKRPGIGDLQLGEIAINTYDGRMFIRKDVDGNIEVVQVGDDKVDNVFYVSKSGAKGNLGTSLQDAFSTLDSAVSLVTALKTFSFDEVLCSRDLNYIIDGLRYDIAYGTNYNAVTSGLAYQRAGSVKVTTEQIVQTRVAFNQARGAIGSVNEVKTSIGYDGALQRNNRHWSEVIDILINGVTSLETAADDLVFPLPNVLPTGDADDAAAILQNNREWFKEEVVSYISANYPGLVYDEAKCRRDVGFIIDGLTFDILYGGTHAITINTRAYFVGAVSQLGAGETAATVDTYNHLKVIVDELVRNSLSSNLASGADLTGNVGQYATTTEGNQLIALLTILTDVLTAGDLSGLPAAINPNLVSTNVDVDLRSAIAGIEEQRNLIVLQSVKSAKNSGDTTIYLKAGDYTIQNPIKLPPKTAIVGDTLRSVTIRPASVDSDLFYMDNGCFITDVTFRDHQNFAACVAFDPKVDSPGAGPFIVQSPYVQNCTSITNDGVGMRVDGSKCSGLRSMVSDAFTQYNAAGYGVHMLNRGYAQLVSIFTISTQTSILAETGGQCSVTNSNSSFGDYGLVARGSSNALYSGKLDSEYPIFSDVVRINNIINLDSSDYIGTFGDYKKPNYNDAMRFDSEEFYYTVLRADSVAPGVFDVTFQPPLNNELYKANQTVSFHQRSQITSSSHTFEFVGAGTNTFTAIPQNGGVPIQKNEVVYDSDTNEGIVVFTSTDQLGDFRIGSELNINRQAGRIEGVTFERSLFAILTPYILALEG
jgi:hypothetical protein